MEGSIEEFYLTQLEMLTKANIQLSAHTINGWEGQYALMMRYFKRAIESEDKNDQFDFWIAFFQNAFYIKDWIKNEKRNDDKKWNQKLNALINNNEALQICRDLCNGTKHVVINDPSIDNILQFFTNIIHSIN